ncbi:hypothetical protein SAMN05421823_105317 [Catalinimonas alkaloidigena]|uniref:Uncharacterized protein n=1 Tax=Catalinimonas alkaloidigena TaxID=1075417 RepID=A0A1G9JIF7_9BACT|nr:hypothetical protein SAMN05421823_105317 [Catalinimonas alkaloidigena]
MSVMQYVPMSFRRFVVLLMYATKIHALRTGYKGSV